MYAGLHLGGERGNPPQDLADSFDFGRLAETRIQRFYDFLKA